MSKLLLSPIIPFLLVLLISPVFAQDVNVSEFGTRLGEALGIGGFGGGLLASTLCIFSGLLFMSCAMKRRPTALELIVLIFPIYSICVFLVWLPVWNFAIIILIIALMFSDKIVKRFR